MVVPWDNHTNKSYFSCNLNTWYSGRLSLTDRLSVQFLISLKSRIHIDQRLKYMLRFSLAGFMNFQPKSSSSWEKHTIYIPTFKQCERIQKPFSSMFHYGLSLDIIYTLFYFMWIHSSGICLSIHNAQRAWIVCNPRVWSIKVRYCKVQPYSFLF